MIIMDIGSGAIAISTLPGLQTLLTGIALVLASFAKKNISGKCSPGSELVFVKDREIIKYNE